MLKKIFENPNVKKITKSLLEWLISGLIGATIGLFFAADFIPAVVVTFALSFILFIILVRAVREDQKYDILGILKAEIKAGNYPIVIQMGYTLSRSLHLSGRYTLREAIGEQVIKACEKLEPTRKLRINDTIIPIKRIEAKTYVDDLGWNKYLLGQAEVAIENIKTGISIAESVSEFDVAIKGYRHLIGIYYKQDMQDEKKEAESKAFDILESDEYKKLFSDEKEYEHAVAEFEYAYATTLIDEDSEKALAIAYKVQRIFSSEKTEDMDRYCKTFGLIGSIYARFNRPDMLKNAKKIFLEGIKLCEKHGRSERLIVITIDYIDLMAKMANNCPDVYNMKSWEEIDKEEKNNYERAVMCSSRIENKDFMLKLKRVHNDYLYRRKQMMKYR